jgi:tRNA(Arg) A34 adenosine deaminase TadA
LVFAPCHAVIEAIRLAVKKLKTNDLPDCISYTIHEAYIMCSCATRFYKIKKSSVSTCGKLFGRNFFLNAFLTSNEVSPHLDEAPVILHLKDYA